MLQCIAMRCSARVRSMRMGLFIPRLYSGNNLGTYRGRAKVYRGCGARDSRLLPWKPVRKFEDSRFQVFTGVPVTYKFSSFHWCPITHRFSRESPNFLTGSHRSKRESRALQPRYIFALPRNVPRLFPTVQPRY